MENMCNCLILGDFCLSISKVGAQSPRCLDDTSVVEKANREDDDGFETLGVDKDVFEGLSCGQVKCIDLKRNLNCITGLAIGGGFLFSSSFDKMVNVWSLQHRDLIVVDNFVLWHWNRQKLLHLNSVHDVLVWSVLGAIEPVNLKHFSRIDICENSLKYENSVVIEYGVV
ncbi:hypothetical protein P3S68_004312 [Capsicum galapagoense]